MWEWGYFPFPAVRLLFNLKLMLLGPESRYLINAKLKQAVALIARVEPTAPRFSLENVSCCDALQRYFTLGLSPLPLKK